MTMKTGSVMALAVIPLILGGTGCRTTASRNDTTITADVRKELAEERLPATIEVITVDRVVTLAGTVPDTQTKTRAETAARNVDGVDRVNNNLRTTMAGDAPITPPAAPKAPPPPAAPRDMQ
jgi:BON domain